MIGRLVRQRIRKFESRHFFEHKEAFSFQDGTRLASPLFLQEETTSRRQTKKLHVIENSLINKKTTVRELLGGPSEGASASQNPQRLLRSSGGF